MSSSVKSSFFVSILTLVSSIISFANQVIIAANFGTGHEMDTYLLLTSFPFLVSGVLGSAFSFSLIPHLVTKSFGYFIQFTKIIITITFVLFLFFLLLYNFVIIDYYNLGNFKHIKILNVVVWLVFFITIIFNVISCYFTSKAKFIVPVILNFLPFIFSIISIIIFSKLGVLSIIIGLLFGYVSAVSYSIVQFKKERIGINEKDFKKEIIDFLKSMKYSALSMLTFSVFQIVDAYWGKKLGESVISYLGYSQRIVIALGALVISGPSAVLIPKLTEAYKKGDLDTYYRDTATVIKLVFALTSFAALLGAFFSIDIVRIMFQRGGFTEVSTRNVAEILPYILIGMVFMLCVVISFRSIFVQPITYKTGIIGILTLILYFTLSGILSKSYNIKGIAFAYIITWIIIFLFTSRMLFKKQFKNFIKEFFLFLLRQFFVLLIVFCVVYFLNLFSFCFFGMLQDVFSIIFKLGIIGIVSSFVYIIISARVIKIRELVLLFSRIPILNRWIF
ncbi:lipid II flippase MurJ [Elizabethkingia anophelis]|uniref:lipid II flippase MurJ n=1 Tax=Elizabethkingia anophelis TaxID=1117645 RepID=UPI0012B244A6|nr:lipid II flippase MurJ [Elizabethkingia anophelis]QGN22122.1 hypothetical protein GJV56_05515 [Elizabethkingia anophelis]QNV08774.1 hypothetical protein EIY88_05485 [Elizabethkingia anophelis]UTF90530.1 hypothetical protein J2N93_05550 [Elizabethkingia anophelis]UTG01401.1 hypothetical protein J2O04_05550 [Elizabethkingia anophelis]UTG05151.1 hypothetical protein J2O03_05550 [Elizabethkingia anophelis]